MCVIILLKLIYSSGDIFDTDDYSMAFMPITFYI